MPMDKETVAATSIIGAWFFKLGLKALGKILGRYLSLEFEKQRKVLEEKLEDKVLKNLKDEIKKSEDVLEKLKETAEVIEQSMKVYTMKTEITKLLKREIKEFKTKEKRKSNREKRNAGKK